MKALLMVIPLVAATLAAQPAPRFDEHLGWQLPLAAQVTDEQGALTTLGALMGGKPAILWFRYLRCPQLCSVIGDGEVASLRQLEASAGRDYSVISVSIDPTDTVDMAAQAREAEVRRYGRHGAERGWHVAVARRASIDALTSSAGFLYTFDSRTRLYSHPSGLLIVTPQGRISAYVTGVDFPAKDIAAGLGRAAKGSIGPSTYQWVISCLEGGQPQGRYTEEIWTALWISVLCTVAVVFGGIGWMLYTEHRTRAEGRA